MPNRWDAACLVPRKAKWPNLHALNWLRLTLARLWKSSLAKVIGIFRSEVCWVFLFFLLLLLFAYGRKV